MNIRIVCILISAGFLLQGCTLQKRSLLPGWHVERTAHTKASVGSHVAEDHTGESVIMTEQPMQLMSSLKELPVPKNKFCAGTPAIETSPERKATEAMQSEVRLEHQRVEEVVPNLGSASPEEPTVEETDKKRKRKLSTLAALLGVGAMFAFRESNRVFWRPTARRLKWLGAGLIAMALVILRFAFPYAASESSEQVPDRKEGRGKRIAMGVLAVGLGFASGMAIAWGLFGQYWPLVVLGVGLGLLALRALVVAVPNAFPRLRALMTKRS